MHVDVAIGTSGSSGSRSFTEQNIIGYSEPDPDDIGKQSSVGCLEPDPDDPSNANIRNPELRIDEKHHREPDPDDGACEFVLESGNKMEVESELRSNTAVLKSEPDPDDSSNAILNQEMSIYEKHSGEPDPDDTTRGAVLESGNKMEVETEPSRNPANLKFEPDPDDHTSDSSISELQRIEEPVAALCSRRQKDIEMLRLQVRPEEAASAFQTLFKIIKNVIDYPNDIKYRRLRKSNPQF